MTRYLSVVRGHSYEAMRLYVEEIVHQSYPISSILAKLHHEIVTSQDVKDVNKALICEKIAKVSNESSSSNCVSLYVTGRTVSSRRVE